LIRPKDDIALPKSATVTDGQGGLTVDHQNLPSNLSNGDVWKLDQLPPELEYFRTSEAYQVELEEFSGPLDLLLYLIQKDQLDIYDIPIARITEQYLKYLEVIQLLTLDNAGDFLVMAATLLRIKTRMLLPVQAEEESLEEDPRAELVRRLLEYKRFKEAAAELRKCEEERRHYFLRSTQYPFEDNAETEPPLRIEMYDLLAALAGVIDHLTTSSTHRVQREPFTVEQKFALIHERLTDGEVVHFEDLFAADTIKMEVVVTFIALLELARQQLIIFYQTEIHGPIWIKRNPQAGAWQRFTTLAYPTVATTSNPEFERKEVEARS